MSFDTASLSAALRERPRVARVVVAEVAGSAPREVGAAMLVWPGGQSGTIGGGALELAAADHALGLIDSHTRSSYRRHALGPALGQCCGGAVGLLSEIYDTVPEGPVLARPFEGSADMPLPVRRLLAEARATGIAPGPQLVHGWLIEPVARPGQALWVYGAGHVGRALVDVLAPLPAFEITWIDTAAGRFPAEIPEGVTPLVAANPAEAVKHAPPDAMHIVLTYSHALDLEICHQLLGHGFAGAGLIGSASKWARFRKRLGQLGHADAQISRIRCPIGRPELGKHPQAIAVGVAAGLLTPATTYAAKEAAR